MLGLFSIPEPTLVFLKGLQNLVSFPGSFGKRYQLLFFFFKLIFIGVYLLYNVVLVSAVQQSI